MELELITKKECRGGFVFVFMEHLNERPMGSIKTEHQRMVVARCLSKILKQNHVNIEHRDSGAPYLPEYPDQFISISHSKNWYAIQLSKVDEVGIDIQLIKENIHEGRSYFINTQEESSLDLNYLNLNLIWSAKEALYKFMKGEVEQYKESITVLKIDENEIVGSVGSEIISCGYLRLGDTVLVYVN